MTSPPSAITACNLRMTGMRIPRSWHTAPAPVLSKNRKNIRLKTVRAEDDEG